LLAGRAAGDEMLDQIVDLQRRHAGQRLRVEHLEHRCQQLARDAHQRQFVRGLDHPETAASCADTNRVLTMSLNDSVGLASASMPIFIQNSACALIDRHITVLARRASSCSSSSIFTMPIRPSNP
jgi:hypothetical protein